MTPGAHALPSFAGAGAPVVGAAVGAVVTAGVVGAGAVVGGVVPEPAPPPTLRSMQL
nr:hypothetical protein GCM10020092_007410 [Actinoplanes digitatis]